MYFTGIDMGSTCTKLIVLDEGGAIAYKKVVSTGWNCVETAKGLIDEKALRGRICLSCPRATAGRPFRLRTKK